MQCSLPEAALPAFAQHSRNLNADHTGTRHEPYTCPHNEPGAVGKKRVVVVGVSGGRATLIKRASNDERGAFCSLRGDVVRIVPDSCRTFGGHV
jgi:hypothetical protein